VKCADVRHLIHLSVGDDTLPDEEQSVTEHLHECSDCRGYHSGMMDAMQAVYAVRDSDVVDPDTSVWSSVRRAMRSKRAEQHRPQRQINGGVVALCACSLVLALVTIVQKLPANSSDGAEMPVMWLGTPVNWPGQSAQQQVRSQWLLLPPVRLKNPDRSTAGFHDPATNRLFTPASAKSVVPATQQGPLDF